MLHAASSLNTAKFKFVRTEFNSCYANEKIFNTVCEWVIFIVVLGICLKYRNAQIKGYKHYAKKTRKKRNAAILTGYNNFVKVHVVHSENSTRNWFFNE